MEIRQEKNHTTEKSPNDIIAEMLQTILKSHPLIDPQTSQITQKDNVVIIEPYQIKVTCFITNQQVHQNMLVLNFAFITQVNNGKQMIEELPAFAEHSFDAYMQGVQNFTHGFLSTLLHAYFGYHYPDYNLMNENEHHYHVTSGDIQVQGRFFDIELEQNHLVDILFSKLQEMSVDLYDDYYGIKIYMSRQNGTDFMGDCKIDNNDWQDGLKELLYRDYPFWIKTSDFLAKKQWIILKKCAHQH